MNVTSISNFKIKYNSFLELTRAYSLPVSMFAWFVAMSWAIIISPNMANVILSFLAIMFLHLGTNLLDDYVDVRRELKKGICLKNITFEGAHQKARLIKNGTYPLTEVVKIIGILYLIPILIGGYFTWLLGPKVIVLALMAAVLCIMYPFSTKCGLGELIIATLFGPLLTYGVFYVITGMASVTLQAFAITVALFNVVIVHTHCLMDWEQDVARGKKTLCTILRTKKLAIVTLITLLVLAYANVALLVFIKYLSPWFLLIFSTLPIAVELVKSMKDYIALKDVELKPRWFYGPMEDWQQFKGENTHYFMYRFLLARNLAMFSCMIAGVVYYLTRGMV